jgi:murein DD-endopeptidase MepM/ murein hydrolase activator NlpD
MRRFLVRGGKALARYSLHKQEGLRANISPLCVAALCLVVWLGAAGTAHASQPALTLQHPMAWGETLADVSAQFGVPVDALAAANGIGDLYMLHPGRWLALPPDGTGSSTEPSRTYTVQPGDTLFHVAAQFGTTVDALAAANGLADPSSIQVGQTLTIPGSSAGTAAVSVGPLRSLEWLPAPVRQGQTLVIKAQAAEGAVLDGSLDGQPVAFTRDGDGLFALVPIGIGELPGARELIVWAGSSAGDRVRAALTVQIVKGQFETSFITIPPDRTYLLDAEILEQDRQALARAFGIHTVKRLWDGTFLQPIQGTLTESFGAQRTYNDGARESWHGGIDLGALAGTPVRAANAGRVVFTGTLQAYGNGVVIDHGLGLCTAYFHLNSIAVQIGQAVGQGDIVGQVGNTGLSTGAHLHWEMRLNDVPVDPAQWMYQTIP